MMFGLLIRILLILLGLVAGLVFFWLLPLRVLARLPVLAEYSHPSALRAITQRGW